MNYMVTEIYDALVSADADEAKARAAAERMASFERGTDDQFALLREDNEKLRTEMADLRGELKGEISDLRGEVKAEISDLRGEVKAEISDLRGEVKAEISSLRGEYKAEMSDLRGEMTTGHSSLRGEITLIKWMFGVMIATNIAILFRLFS